MCQHLTLSYLLYFSSRWLLKTYIQLNPLNICLFIEIFHILANRFQSRLLQMCYMWERGFTSSGEEMYNSLDTVSFWERESWNIVWKRRYCSFLAVASFSTRFFKSLLLQKRMHVLSFSLIELFFFDKEDNHIILYGVLTLSLIRQFCSRRLWTYFVKK